MPTLTVTTLLTYGSTTPDGSVPAREPYNFTLTYTEASVKTVKIAANVTDFEITTDTVGSPAFLFAQALDADVDVKLSDGVVVTPTPTKLSASGGWILLSNPAGQQVNTLLVTTPASPTSGARVRVLAFE